MITFLGYKQIRRLASAVTLTLRRTSALAAVLGLALSCNASSSKSPGAPSLELTANSSPTPTSKRAAAKPAKKASATQSMAASRSRAGVTHSVVLISIDGLASRFLEQELDAARLPNFLRMRREGATTHNAQTAFGITYTIPNHTSMLTGRPVLAVASRPEVAHGVTINTDPFGATTLHNAGNVNVAYLASAFDETHDRGGYTSLYSGKPKFDLFRRSYSGIHARRDTIGENNGVDKLDDFEVLVDSPKLVANFIRNYAAGVGRRPVGPNFSMLHYRDTDSAGHRFGWGGTEYLAALHQADHLIGGVMDAIGSVPALRGTVIILTADHGGIDLGHHDSARPEVFKIPFYVWGAPLPPGSELYALSQGTRTAPRADVAIGNQGPQPIRNGDAANLAMSLLGLPPITGSWYTGLKLAYTR